MGLFKNQELVAWAEPCDQPSSFHGFEDCSFYCLPPLQVELTAEDTLCAAALVTDTYGRTILYPSSPYAPDQDMELTYASSDLWDTDPNHWVLE